MNRRRFLTAAGSLATATTVTTAGCLGVLGSSSGGQSAGADNSAEVDTTIETSKAFDAIGSIEPGAKTFIHHGSDGTKLVVAFHVRTKDDFGARGDCVDFVTEGTAYDGEGNVVDRFTDTGVPYRPGLNGTVSRVFDKHVHEITRVELSITRNADQSACEGSQSTQTATPTPNEATSTDTATSSNGTADFTSTDFQTRGFEVSDQVKKIGRVRTPGVEVARNDAGEKQATAVFPVQIGDGDGICVELNVQVVGYDANGDVVERNTVTGGPYAGGSTDRIRYTFERPARVDWFSARVTVADTNPTCK